ncbi:MAG TPA: sterol desaturase family protein [Thermoleophilaceae bacterium]|jgi:sterol desaturase/sphingolipid hydroxylase (fatty acid hydroxylase superfamily)
MSTETRRTDVLKASPRMFDSELLDKLSRVHPAVPVVIFLPAISILLALGAAELSAWTTIGMFAGGYAFWTLSEYWIHRAIFHFEPEHGLGARLHWIIHGVHHDHPNDPLRLVMPPSVSVPLSSLFVLGFWAVFGAPLFLPFAAGFLAGYLAYDMTHYALHHHKPKTRLGKRLRELHMRHHFQDHTTGFGISAPYWDKAFGTFPEAAEKQRR